MINFFNRKELISTFDLNEQAQIRNALSKSGIDYQIKTKDLTSPTPISTGTRERTGNFGINQDFTCEYTFYVKKEDFEKALDVIK